MALASRNENVLIINCTPLNGSFLERRSISLQENDSILVGRFSEVQEEHLLMEKGLMQMKKLRSMMGKRFNLELLIRRLMEVIFLKILLVVVIPSIQLQIKIQNPYQEEAYNDISKDPVVQAAVENEFNNIWNTLSMSIPDPIELLSKYKLKNV
ncbi:hypothetical protein ROZALSC1DRAFT_20919 [Rozella allomycis CSF55]|uniref:Uncharacterized protein n=1 Tax=Rozella allomycis (strain CSF55) TaxID=988480 RepID=A0A4P9YPJ4_ROZAC|nr:hypothetical protein ROZALSC1DRAFT_20919 [Rozella allomycis CSF55]